MRNETILKKAIEQAIRNGYKLKWIEDFDWEVIDVGVVLYDKGAKKGASSCGFIDYPTIIFDHDFARTFFGVNWPDRIKIVGTFPYWRMELTQLVLEKDPIKYLEAFLDKEKSKNDKSKI